MTAPAYPHPIISYKKIKFQRGVTYSQLHDNHHIKSKLSFIVRFPSYVNGTLLYSKSSYSRLSLIRIFLDFITPRVNNVHF